MRVALHTFGCKANQYDSEVVRQALEAAGVTVVDESAEADAAVVNSCTVTHVSEAKMRGLVRRLARRSPGIHTVVMGCAAALDDGTIERLPGVVDVIGGSDPTRVLAALELPTESVPRTLRSFNRGSRAWLKIQDGCDEHCTFCATTLARGANRSRPMDEVVREAATLASVHAEIVLTGVHIGTYGHDLADGVSLSTLAETLVAAVPDVRIRLSSVEATELDHRLGTLMRTEPGRLAPHLHAPLQSGSDRVLRRMGRHWYTAATYCDRIERLAADLPALGLGADVMVGFPGETEADHERTCALIEALPFTYLHVFPYSERLGAPARRLGPPVDPAVAHRRAAELRTLGHVKGERYRRLRSGTQADVVVVRRRAGRFEGLTEDYLTVHGPVGRPPRGRFDAQLECESDGGMRAVVPEGLP
jgi:threonylcarbamoyladenosine tRNA methylthiotransferase MtaB